MSIQKIEAGDTVHHAPCDENWYVLGVNYTTGRLCVGGWPHTIAEIADCTVVEKGTGITEEEVRGRQRMFGGGWE